MNNKLDELTDNEKLAIFNVAIDQSKETQKSFESQIGLVLNAFFLRKEKSSSNEQEINTSFNPSLSSDSAPMGMRPLPDTQRIDNNYSVPFN